MKPSSSTLGGGSRSGARRRAALLAVALSAGFSADSAALGCAEVRATLNALIAVRDDADTAHESVYAAQHDAHDALGADRLAASRHYHRAHLDLERARAVLGLVRLNLRDTVIRFASRTDIVAFQFQPTGAYADQALAPALAVSMAGRAYVDRAFADIDKATEAINDFITHSASSSNWAQDVVDVNVRVMAARTNLALVPPILQAAIGDLTDFLDAHGCHR